MNGVVSINKPKGWTSRDVVNKVRNVLHEKSAGHMGTLDPQGEGVLLVGIGKGTRLFDVFLKKDKVYRADFAFGYETDTLDGDGEMTSKTDVVPTLAQIEEALPEMLGDIMQLPPIYSAKNVGGVRAYELARKGVTVDLKPASVSIYSIDIEKYYNGVLTVRVHCSAGTYIRSICRDLAYKLNSLATMTSITRLRAGSFKIEDSVTVDELIGLGEKAVISLDEALKDFPKYLVKDEDYDRLSNGIKLDVEDDLCAPFTVYCRDELFGLGEIVDKKLKIKTYLKG